jgi:hypothetical protein
MRLRAFVSRSRMGFFRFGCNSVHITRFRVDIIAVCLKVYKKRRTLIRLEEEVQSRQAFSKQSTFPRFRSKGLLRLDAIRIRPQSDRPKNPL